LTGKAPYKSGTNQFRTAPGTRSRRGRRECIDPHRLLVDAGKAVEVGQPLVIIVEVLDPLDRLADFVPGELEGTRT
jgi:hypothetical protein